MAFLIENDALCQRVRALFDLLDWSVVAEPPPDAHRRGHRPHPQSAYLKALLLKLWEGLLYCTTLRRFLVEHPLLVLALGFYPHSRSASALWLRRRTYRAVGALVVRETTQPGC